MSCILQSNRTVCFKPIQAKWEHLYPEIAALGGSNSNLWFQGTVAQAYFSFMCMRIKAATYQSNVVLHTGADPHMVRIGTSPPPFDR